MRRSTCVHAAAPERQPSGSRERAAVDVGRQRCEVYAAAGELDPGDDVLGGDLWFVHRERAIGELECAVDLRAGDRAARVESKRQIALSVDGLGQRVQRAQIDRAVGGHGDRAVPGKADGTGRGQRACGAGDGGRLERRDALGDADDRRLLLGQREAVELDLQIGEGDPALECREVGPRGRALGREADAPRQPGRRPGNRRRVEPGEGRRDRRRSCLARNLDRQGGQDRERDPPRGVEAGRSPRGRQRVELRDAVRDAGPHLHVGEARLYGGGQHQAVVDGDRQVGIDGAERAPQGPRRWSRRRRR